ncbi:hypothetical protein SAMN05216404_106123 [Nitrosospira multiformis]|uniref:Uncharacterized protein n=1 Tax=Nitrosospira multiformis TaxID=1231 RepID=A0A1H8IMT6_9PROT|nr:hypothetical protein SAMN05216404_106123 [Nitrosospira multiformis]
MKDIWENVMRCKQFGLSFPYTSYLRRKNIPELNA